MHYPLRLKLGAVAAIFFFASTIAVVSLIVWRHESLAQSAGGDAAWAAYKLDREAIELRSRLLHSEPGVEEDLATVQLDFELLYSRTHLLRNGQIAELFHSIPAVNEVLPSIFSQVEDIDAIVSNLVALTPEGIESLDIHLSELGDSSQRLVIATNEYMAESKTRERETLLHLYALLLALILLKSLAAVVIIRFLFQEARDNDASRRAMETLSQELEATAYKAESASRAKSEFLATVSHEVRTPLNGVIGMSALLMERQTDPQSRRYAQTIHESAEILLSLINDILDFSKIEAGRLELEKAAFDLRGSIEGVSALFAPRPGGSAITFSLQVDPQLPRRFIGDSGRIRQVLLNLLSNAFKFTAEGHVELAVRRIENGKVLFEVSDTGCGIPVEQREELFEPFRQGDASTARRFGGSGLGLTISKRLVTAMGGRIGFDSLSGVGSRFWFVLPLKAAPEMASPQPERMMFAHGGGGGSGLEEHLLVAEDNPVNQQVAVAMLERFGYCVDVAVNGAEAVEMAQAKPYAMIFMDMQMPGMDGLEATQRIRAAGSRLAEVPIIAMTASALGGEQTRAYEAGMNDYLTKPVMPASLGAVLSRYLGSMSRTLLDEQFISPDGAVDHVLLRELESTLGLTMFKDLLKLYRQQVPERLAALEEALYRADTDEMARQAHLLKGESSGLGLTAVAALAGDLELHAHRLAPAAREQQVKALQQLIERSLAELESRDEALLG